VSLYMPCYPFVLDQSGTRPSLYDLGRQAEQPVSGTQNRRNCAVCEIYTSSALACRWMTSCWKHTRLPQRGMQKGQTLPGPPTSYGSGSPCSLPGKSTVPAAPANWPHICLSETYFISHAAFCKMMQDSVMLQEAGSYAYRPEIGQPLKVRTGMPERSLSSRNG